MREINIELAREIAGRIWQDQEMRHVVMDVEAAEKIATILLSVLLKQAAGKSS